MTCKNLLKFGAVSALMMFSGSALAVNIGYYDMNAGQGVAAQEAPIIAAGHSPVQIVDLSAAELGTISILMVQNPSNSSYGAEYLAALADIEAAVNGGMGLIIHDRYVDAAETILPDGGAFDIIRNFDDDANIEVINDTTTVTNGPGGVIDNTSLDGGNSSSHGFAVLGGLPAGGTFILSRTNPDEIVTFSYPVGGGGVLYSSIPLDFYLNGSGDPAVNANMLAYATNVVAYGAEGGIQDIDGSAYFLVTKTYSDGSSAPIDVTLSCNGGLPLEQTFTLPGNNSNVRFVVTNLPDTGTTCTITESNGPANYTPMLNGGDGCTFDNIMGGYFPCYIVNEANPGDYIVAKEWVISEEGSEEDSYAVDIDVTCSADIIAVDGVPSTPSMTYAGSLDDGESVILSIDTSLGDAQCSATETFSQSGVEPSASAECDGATVSAGSGATCLFTNTVFFEGIPSLDRYGLALLTLLLLGVGMIGVRRFA